MAKKIYPFIVCYSGPHQDLYAREPDENAPDEDFRQVDDQLEATVYRNLRTFKRGFGISPTEWVEKHNKNPWADGHIVTLIYVG